ncbi:putative serine/threonine protein kinase, variant 1 [Trichoderma compactum]
MEITTRLISGNEDETAVFAESHSGDLSLVFRFNLDISQPLSTNSRIVACFHEIEVDDGKKTFSDRESMRQGIYDLISHVWPLCAANPSIRLPDVIVHIQQDDHGETTFRISHESAFRKYLASLLPVSSIKDALIPQVRTTELHYISLESLQFSDILGGRGGTTVTHLKDQKDGQSYVYKGLSFRLFLEGNTVYKSERDTFYRELGVVYSLPSHPNVLRAPPLLVATGPPQSANHGIAEKDRLICGTLYPFLERQSLQEVISQSNENHSTLPLTAKAKWARQISSAMAAVHSSGQYHMDLKPSNMLLNNEDDVVIIDWEQCGASPFFLAPEADGSWDVEVVINAEPAEMWKTNPGKDNMVYRKFIGPLRDDFGVWPRRNVFQLWQSECRRALEAAEVYSVGRSLWAIFEQSEDVWTYDRRQPEAKELAWTERSESVPEVWKDFVSRCTRLDPNKRPTFGQGEEFWGQEWQQLEGHTN